MASLVIKLYVTHLCPVGFEYTNVLCFTSLQKSFEEQLLGEERKHHTDLKFYMREKWQLKKELETLKVSVPYMHMTAILSHLPICFMSQDRMNENCQPVLFNWDKF